MTKSLPCINTQQTAAKKYLESSTASRELGENNELIFQPITPSSSELLLKRELI